MTETLQDKIDCIISDLWLTIHTPTNDGLKQYNNQVEFKEQINKAIQELREEIQNRIKSMDEDTDEFEINELETVLTLIGEDK